MVNKVDKNLVVKIGRHVNRRKSASNRKSAVFTETISEKQGLSGSIQKRPKSAKNLGRKTRSTGNVKHSKKGYTRQHITKTQANRLAQYAPIIKRASKKYNVPIELICGVILQESGGNFKAVSHCGARGLMQIMPATAKRLGVKNSFDPAQNITGGAKYLRMLLDRFDGNMSLALAGYNAGEGNVEKYGRKIPPFKETQAYVPKVLKFADTIWHVLRSGSKPVRRVDISPTIPNREVTHPRVQTNVYHHTIYSSRRA